MDANHPLESGYPAAVLPVYTPPAVITYTDEQLLEALGPAQAQSYAPG